MRGFAFTPEQIVVPLGSTVVWVNEDGAPHTATADDGQAFQSDLIARGQSFQFTATELGEFPYFCELHGSAGGVGMAGIVKVVAAGEVPAVTAEVGPAPALAAAEEAPTPAPSIVDEQHLPDGSFAGIHQLLVDGPGAPVRQGYAVGLENETEEMHKHVKLLVQSE